MRYMGYICEPPTVMYTARVRIHHGAPKPSLEVEAHICVLTWDVVDLDVSCPIAAIPPESQRMTGQSGTDLARARW